MSKNLYVHIRPEVLKWARESLHLDQNTAVEYFDKKSRKKFSLDLKTIQRYETEPSEIRLTLLKEFAKLYKRPLAVFFMDSPPKERRLPKDFRTLSTETNEELSSKVMFVIRKIERTQLITQELSKELGITYAFKLHKYPLSSDPNDLARELRKKVNLSRDLQRQLKSSGDFFRWLRNRLEAMGVLIIKESFPMEDARAFSIVDEEPFTIVINGRDGGVSYAPKLFSMMHEFAHILIREGAICNDFFRTSGRVERFCNQFAASFLVPPDFFNDELHNIITKFHQDEVEEYLEKLQKIFRVSKPVLLLRFLEVDLIDSKFYESKIVQWEEEYTRKLKEGKSFTVHASLPQRVVGNFGKSFTRLILNAQHTEKITIDSAAEYLDISAKYLPELDFLIREDT